MIVVLASLPGLLCAFEPPDDSRLEEIEQRLDRLEQENEDLRAQLESRDEEAADEFEAIPHANFGIGGYVDVGFFVATGDGTGFRRDLGNAAFPELDEIPGTWVFLGDPLATMVNSRGEAADLSGSRAMQLDLIHAGDRPTFIVNALNLNPSVQMGEQLSVEGLVDFLPRTRDPAATGPAGFGDFVDIKRAMLRWVPETRQLDIDVRVGKIDSVIGREYRYQEAPERMTITPSLACRYTCGRSIGLSSRLAFLNRSVFLNLAVTNGSNTQEFFGLHDEVDSNAFKTLSGRVAYRPPIPVHVEVGASGAYGAQDLQRADDVNQWQYGFDLNFRFRDLELTGEYVMFRSEGQTSSDGADCDLSPCLDSMVVYGLASYRITSWMAAYFRTGWRDAVHRHGTEYAYVTDGLRLTPGLNFPVSPHATIKLEYVVNLELRRIPDFKNDVFTSSVVGYF